ncbi:hypothetical protein SLS63_010488 [Diaporthe eres]|uniref:Uncharacterized protein n=1 Tax=Diaporthe eres TaxID=83184 RepID=A0ABR1NWL2_DIAER
MAGENPSASDEGVVATEYGRVSSGLRGVRGGGAGGSAFIIIASSVGILCSVLSLEMSVDLPVVDLPSSLVLPAADLVPPDTYDRVLVSRDVYREMMSGRIGTYFTTTCLVAGRHATVTPVVSSRADHNATPKKSTVEAVVC